MFDREKVIRCLEYCTNGQEDCGSCPYNGIDARIGQCFGFLMRDALALLKDQEPRVMTFDEVWEREVMFYDFIDWSDEEICPAARVGNYLEVSTLSDAVMLDDGNDDWREYGKTWRCWTARPTEEQRAEAKWDES